MGGRRGWKIYFWLCLAVMLSHLVNAVRYLQTHGLNLELYLELWLVLLQVLRYAAVGFYAWRRRAFAQLFWRVTVVLEVLDFLFFQGVKFMYLFLGIPYSGPGWPQHESYAISVRIFLTGILFLSFSYVASFLYAFRSRDIWQIPSRGKS